MEFPNLFTSAETSSAQNQRTFLCARAAEFMALAVAAGFGEMSGKGIWRAGPFLALFFFLIALVVRSTGLGDRAEKRWYDSRAASESVKSSTWQYAVGGDAFRKSDTDSNVRFVSSLKEVLLTLPNLDIPASPKSSSSITDDMATLRASSQEVRRQRYINERVIDQVGWYAKKANINREKARLWRNILIGVESLAGLLGLLRILGYFEVNWLGAFAAAAAGVAAWQQTKNFSLLSEVYSVTSHEVKLVQESLSGSLSEDQWAEAVREAETAFSREHTMWLARRLGTHHH